MKKLEVVYEDNHLLVVNKPVGIATMGTDPETPTMARMAASYLKEKYHKPGNVFVGVVSRIDRLVSGVLILARTSKGASRLSEQIRNRQVAKRYLAIVEGQTAQSIPQSIPLGIPLAAPQGISQGLTQSTPLATDWIELVHHVRKNENRQRMEVVSEATESSQVARLQYRTLAQANGQSLVMVNLITGRKHQIRLQLSEMGHPVVGDAKYGATQSMPSSSMGASGRKPNGGIALHCYALKIMHPTRREPLTFVCSPRQHWGRLPKAFVDALIDLEAEAASGIGDGF